MDHNLALKLKNAGFKTKGKCQECIGNSGKDCSGDIFPTLSELIAACGEEFGVLAADRVRGGWNAFTNNLLSGTPNGNGLTPEEAVANLWLALNSTPPTKTKGDE